MFEVDQVVLSLEAPVPDRARLRGVPDWLRFVPVDFETGESWRDGLVIAGFDDSKPAIVLSTGFSMYLTKGANAATLRQVAALALESTLAMTRRGRGLRKMDFQKASTRRVLTRFGCCPWRCRRR